MPRSGRNSRKSKQSRTMPRGKHCKYDPARVAQALIDAEGDVSAACRAIGCGRVTIYEYKERFPEVKAAYDEWRPVMVETAKSNIMAILKDRTHPKHYDASVFVLKGQAKADGWTERHEVTGADGGGLVVEFVPTDA